MAGRPFLGIVLGVALAAFSTSNAQAFFNGVSPEDGVLRFEVVAGLPNENDDGDEFDPNINDNTSVQDNCFIDYKPPTATFDFTSNRTLGSDDVDIIQFLFREKSDFGFNENAEYEDDNGDLQRCSDVSDQWDEYEAAEGATLFVFSGAEFKIEAGDSGTEVSIDEGFSFILNTGSRLTLEGSQNDPVVVKGNQWDGFTIGVPNLWEDVSANLSNCTVESADGSGAFRVAGPTASLTANNCEFNNNAGNNGGAIQAREQADISITSSIFDGNEGTLGGAIYFENMSTTAKLTDVTFNGNAAFSRGGGIHIDTNDNNPLSSNLDLINTTFVDNESGRGGAISTGGDLVNLNLWNAVIAGNETRRFGGGIYLDSGFASVNLFNPTIAYNLAGNSGGGIYLANAGTILNVTNGILAENVIDDDDGRGTQIDNSDGGSLITLDQILVNDAARDIFAGNVSERNNVFRATPGFRDTPGDPGVDGGSDRADFRPAADSAALNAGDDSLFDISALGSNPGDRDGADRIFGQEDPRIDVGAFEFQNNPPTLLDTEDQDLSADETDEAVRLELCTRYRDQDQQPDFPFSERRPWLTRAPGDDEETRDRGSEDEQESGDDAEADAGNEFGTVAAFDGGEPGDTIQAGSAIGDSDGRAFYEPANRSTDYEVVIQCRVRDVLIDFDEEVNDELSLLSTEDQRVTVAVAAQNDVPEFQERPDREAIVGRAFQSTATFSDPDEDHAAGDLEARIVDGPDWLSIRRTEDGEITFEGVPPEAGEFDVEYEVVDPGGGTRVEEVTITAEPPDEDREPVDAGDDVTTAPGEEVRLSAQGPEESGLRFRWRIEDGNGDTIAEQEGQTFNWEAEEGDFTATVELIENDTVIDQDSLSVTAAAGLDGGTQEQEEREEPSEEDEADLDGMSDDGDAGNQQQWDEQSDSEKSDSLAEIAAKDLSEEQQDEVLAEAEEVLAEATAAGEPVPEEVAEGLAETYGNLAGLELSQARQAAVAAGADDLREQAAADGRATSNVRAGLTRSSANLLQQEDANPDLEEALNEALDGDVDDLNNLIADDEEPLSTEEVANAAEALGTATGVDLDGEQRTAIRQAQEALRTRAEEDGTGSAAVTAQLIRGVSGLLADDELAIEERDPLLAAAAQDIAGARQRAEDPDNPRPLSELTANRALAALCNAAAAGELGGEQIDQALGGTRDAVIAAGSATAAQLTTAAVCVGDLLNALDGAGLSSEQRTATREVADLIARTAMENARNINATGNSFFKVAARTMPGAATEATLVGRALEQGPSLQVSLAARDEIRRRNGLGEDADIAFALVALLIEPDDSFVLETFALDPASGNSLSDTSLDEPLRVAIPVTQDNRGDPITLGGAPGNASNVSAEGSAVAFDTGELSRWTLTSAVDDTGESSASDTTSCFLDSLF